MLEKLKNKIILINRLFINIMFGIVKNFIPENFRNQAYENIALPISENQKIMKIIVKKYFILLNNTINT